MFLKSDSTKRLTSSNIKKYVENTYGSGAVEITKKYFLDFPPLLQKDYGGKNDCTLTCMTAIIHYITKRKNKATSIYDDVEKIAKKHFYHSALGTSYFTIRTIFNKALKMYCTQKAEVGYLKNAGYNQNTIVSQIDKNNPLILTMVSDGLGYYKKHSVTVIGYSVYSVNNEKKIFLRIYDNWNRDIGYLDYEKISSVSVLHYLT